MKDIVEFANNHPDRVNPVDPDLTNVGNGCFYFSPDGKPGCIIGNVVALLGGGPDDVKEGAGPGAMLGLFDSLDAANFAGRVQKYADNSTPWGEAVDLA